MEESAEVPSQKPLAMSAEGAWSFPSGDQAIDAPVIEPRGRLPGPGFWAAAGMCVLLMVCQFSAIGAATLPAMALGFPLDKSLTALFLVSTSSNLVVAIGAAMMWYGQDIGQKMAVRLPTLWQTMLVLLLVAPTALVVHEIAAWAAYVLPSFGSEDMLEFAASPWPLVLLIGCVLPGIGEEIFFRGLLGRGLLARYGPWMGVLITSVLFGLIHVDPVQAVGVTVIGIAFQLVYLATRSIAAPMVMHAVNNALTFSAVRADWLIDVEHVPPAIVASSLLTIVPLAILLYRCRSRWICEDGSVWSPGYLTAESPPATVAARLESGRPTLFWLAGLVPAYALLVWMIGRTPGG